MRKPKYRRYTSNYISLKQQQDKRDEWRKWTVDWIERSLGRADSSSPLFANTVLQGVAERLIGWEASDDQPWGRELVARYCKQRPILARLMVAFIKEIEESKKQCANLFAPQKPEPVKQSELIFDALGLVSKFAKNIARGDDTLLAELEDLGVRVLEEFAPQYNPNQPSRATFTTFVYNSLHIRMLGHAVRNQDRAASLALSFAEAEKQLLPAKSLSPVPYDEMDTFSMRTQQATRAFDKAPDSSREVKRYLKKKAVRHFVNGWRQLPTNDMALLKELVAKLKPRQRTVIEGLWLTNPKMTRAALARRLGIRHETKIGAIEKQAIAKIDRWLKEKAQGTQRVKQ